MSEKVNEEVVTKDEVDTEDKPTATEPEKETEPKASNDDVLKVLQDIKVSLQKPGEPAPSKAQIREALKEKTGFTDEQLDLVEQLTTSAARQTAQKTAELQEKVSWSEFEKEIGGVDSSIEKLMREELSQYDVASRGDKVLLKKVYYLALGIQADKAAKHKKADPTSNDKPNDNENIVGRKIVETNKGSVTGLETNSKPSGTPGTQLSDDEKIVAHKMGIDSEEYARAKTTKVVSQLKGKAA